jgi:glutathione synthase/RimK-type ligase-like ATP-grasp enzyme
MTADLGMLPAPARPWARTTDAGQVKVLFVVDREQQWPFDIPGSAVAGARAYLTDPAYGSGEQLRVVNLCRADRYQGRGYYVSLLGEARGHRPFPDVKALEDFQADAGLARLADEIDASARTAIQHEETDRFELDAYFGRDPAARHDSLARQLTAVAKAPLLRARFRRDDDGWKLEKIAAIGVQDVPPQHRPVLREAATEFVTGGRPTQDVATADVPRVAILVDPTEADRPSNDAAIAKFVEAARKVGLIAEVIGPGDIERLPEFQGLFLRTTTNVSHYTYEFSRRAESLGLVVVDDPESVLKCTNKVFLHELMARHRIPTPRTLMVHEGNLQDVVAQLGLPCILKVPDGGFGVGVVKITDGNELERQAAPLLARSELLVGQEWLPTEFDWRVAVFDRRPLFACKYFMAPGHWQIVQHGESETVEGDTVAVSIGEVPEAVIQAAVRAANLIGAGLYGVDLKQSRDRCYVIEINDNPNVDAGNEDAVLGDALYREIMGVFARRIAERRRA